LPDRRSDQLLGRPVLTQMRGRVSGSTASNCASATPASDSRVPAVG